MKAMGPYPSPSLRRVASAASIVALVTVPAVVRADVPKAECIQANTDAQDARRDGKFADSRAQLRKCADASCPGIVRDDCAPARRAGPLAAAAGDLSHQEKALEFAIFDLSSCVIADSVVPPTKVPAYP